MNKKKIDELKSTELKSTNKKKKNGDKDTYYQKNKEKRIEYQQQYNKAKKEKEEREFKKRIEQRKQARDSEMKLPAEIPLYGTFDKNTQATESIEAITFFSKLRREYQKTYGAIGFHCRNEGQRTQNQTMKQKAEGMTTGTADIIIPANPPFICELKSRKPNVKISKEQIEYLLTAKKHGAFVCVALGYEAAFEAFKECYGLI